MKEIHELINPKNINEIKQLNNSLFSSSDYIKNNLEDISNIIYKEFEIIKQYVLSNLNNNSLNEDKNKKSEENMDKIKFKSKTDIKQTLKEKNILFSCIPRLEEGWRDISFDKLGQEYIIILIFYLFIIVFINL